MVDHVRPGSLEAELHQFRRHMNYIVNWSAAAASLIGLFITLKPRDSELSAFQLGVIVLIVVVCVVVAFIDIRDARKRAAKKYKHTKDINDYMFAMLLNSGNCEICSRDASWISEKRIYGLLQSKASRRELTFLVHKASREVEELAKKGAEVIEYGALGYDPVTRFTVVNAGNQASSYVAIGHKKPNEPHTIEEFDSSHPTYSMARDLIRSIRVARDQFAKN